MASRINPETIRQWDAVAVQLGPTPIYDESGEIVPIGEYHKGEIIYVVWHGRAMGIVFGWGICGALTSGFPGALFKGFKNLQRARQAWLEGPDWGPLRGVWTPPVHPRPALPTPGYGPAALPGLGPDVATPTPPPSPTIAASTPEGPTKASGASKKQGPSSGTDETYFSCEELANALPTPAPAVRSTPLRPRPSPIMVSSRVSPQPGTKASAKPPTLHAASNLKPPNNSQGASAKPESVAKAHTPAGLIASPAVTLSSLASTATSSIVVPEGRAYVVVRGDHPGVYTDKETAAIMMGNLPGRKMSAFRSRRKAARFYEQELAAGRVGQPIMENA